MWPYELFGCVFSSTLIEKMIYCKSHICDLCDFHEYSVCVLSKFLILNMIFHKIHIYNPFGLHELFKRVSSNMLLHKMIEHKNQICNLCCIHELFGCVSSYISISVLFGLQILKEIFSANMSRSLTGNQNCNIHIGMFFSKW